MNDPANGTTVPAEDLDRKPTTITRWTSVTKPEGAPQETTWGELFAEFNRAPPRPPLQEGDSEAQRRALVAQLPLWSPAVFEGNYRKTEHVRDVGALVLNVLGARSIEQELAQWADNYGLICGSPFHRLHDTVDRYIVVLPYTRRATGDEHRTAATTAVARYPGYDAAARGPAHPWFFPRTPAHGFIWILLPGQRLLDPADLPPLVASAEISPVHAGAASRTKNAANTRATRRGERFLQRACRRMREAPEGVRHSTLVSLATAAAHRVIDSGLDHHRAQFAIADAARQSGLPDDEIDGVLRWASANLRRWQR